MTGRLFSNTIGVLKRSLDVRLLKHNLITGNLANSEVPGYQFKDVSFKDAMRTAMKGPEVRMSRTDKRHLSSEESSLPGMVTHCSQDLDQEMVKLAENNLMYQASVQLLAKKFEGIKTAIEGGR
ncbi:MAG: flagellar basal body rod protein FlgB [Pseudomonadota bacterium]